MLHQTTIKNPITAQIGVNVYPVDTLLKKDASKLIKRLMKAGWLNDKTVLPAGWRNTSELLQTEVMHFIRENLTKEGYQRLLEALRFHNHGTTGEQWIISDPANFLAAVDLALSREKTYEARVKKGIVWEDILRSYPQEKIAAFAHSLPQEMQAILHTLSKNESQNDKGSFSLTKFWIQLSSFFKRTRAEAQIEHALSEASLYTARAVGTDVERSIALAHLDKLREQLQPQLKVFYEEQGLPLPKPYSREEAYVLRMLTAHLVSLAESEEQIANRASSLAKQQIALEGERTEAMLYNKTLPGLLETLSQVNPMREELVREQIRHKSSTLVSYAVSTVMGSLWGAIESISEVTISRIARFAPIVTLPLLIGLVTLVAQTVAGGVPLTLTTLGEYVARAIWNFMLALGGTLVIGGIWQYLHNHRDAVEDEGNPEAANLGGIGNEDPIITNLAK